jgi:hypothetical protein
MNITVLWDVRLCSVVDSYILRLVCHFQGIRVNCEGNNTV